MALFNFLKKKEEPRFVGRNQQAINTYLLLGEEISDSEIQKAIGRDITERAEILSEIERNEENSVGDLKLNYAPSSLDVHTRTLNIMREGYERCILQNDLELENRCLKLVELAKNRIINLVQPEQEDDAKKSLSKMENLTWALRASSFFELGQLFVKEQQQGRFDTTDVQKAWFILWLLNNPKNVISHFTIFPPDIGDLKIYEAEVKKLAEKLLAMNTINNAQVEEINSIFNSLVEIAEASN